MIDLQLKELLLQSNLYTYHYVSKRYKMSLLLSIINKLKLPDSTKS